MKKLLLLITLIAGNFIYAQVGIGTDMPNPSTQLEVKSSNRGVLMPQVPLTSATDQTTISAGNVESLLVYNTSTNATLSPGYYYWYQGSWHRLTNESDLPDNIVYWDVVNNQFTYVDEYGNTQIINISDLETLTVLTDNGDGTFTYTDEDGNDVTFDANTTSMADNGDGTYTLTNANGDSIVVDTNANTSAYDNSNSGLTSTNVQGALDELANDLANTTDALVDNGDGTFTHTAVDGTVVTFDANTTSMVDNGDGTYTLTNANGDSIVVDTNANTSSYDNTNSGLASTNVQDALDELANDLANTTDALVDNGDGTFTHTAVDGTVVTFDANTTSMADNGDGTYTLTNANGDSIVVNTNANTSTYDNTNSGLASTNVQDALDELANDLANTTDALVDNGNGTFTHTAVDGTVVTFDANTTSMADNGDGTYTLTNANGDSIVVDTNANTSSYDNTNSGLASTNVQDALDELANDLANTTDALVDNGNGTFTHTAVDGTEVTFDANTTSMTDNGNGTYTLTNANGNSIVVDTNANTSTYDNTNSGLASTNVQDALDELANDLANTTDALVDNGDGTFTHTAVNGTEVTFDANTTSMVDNGNGTYTLTNANGNSIVVDTNANTSTYDNTNSGLASTNVQDALDELAGNLANTTDALVDNGDGTFTHTAVDGTEVTFDANTTSMTDNGNGTYTLTNANGNSIVVDTNANTSSYDNTNSGLASTNVQDALDELANDLANTTDALVDHGDGTFTHTAVNGTEVTFDANTTSVDVENGVYTFTDGKGHVITTIDTNADALGFDNSTSSLTSTNVQDAIEELLGTISVGAGVNLVDNTDGSFSLVASNGTVISTVTKSDLTDSGNGAYTFTNGDGTDISFDVNTVDVSLNTTTNEYEFKDSEGNVIGSIDMNADNVAYDNTASGLLATNVQGALDELANDLANTTDALVDHGDGTFTHTAVNGTEVTFDANTTSVNVENGVYTFTDGKGHVITTIDTNADALGFDNSTSSLTSTNVQDAIEELLGTISVGAGVNLVDNTDGSFSLVASNGTVISTVTKSDLTDSGNGAYTFTNGDGTDISFDVNTVDVSLNTTTNEYEFKDSEGNVIGSIDMNADNVAYDNTASGLLATNVQGALDELANQKGDLTVNGGLEFTGGTDGVDKLLSDARIQIADGGITTAKIADNAVTTDKIADDAVTTDKIVSGNAGEVLVTNTNGDVTWVNQEDFVKDLETLTSLTYNETDNKLSYKDELGNTNEIQLNNTSLSYNSATQELVYVNSQGQTQSISLVSLVVSGKDLTAADGSIVVTDGSGATLVDSNIKVAEGGITTAKIEDNAVTTDKIADGEVKAEDLGAAPVDVGKVGVVQSDGTVVYQNISSNNVTYNNGTSSLTSDNVQDAIDELATSIDNNKGDLTVNGGLEFTGGADGVDKLLSDTGIQIADKGITTTKIAPGSNNQVMVTNDQGDVSWVDQSEVGEILEAKNGLNKDGLDIKLGGTLIEPTTITTDVTNTLAVAGLQTGSINDQLVVAQNDGTLRQIKAAMPKFFYMPSVIMPTAPDQVPGMVGASESGGVYTINLHTNYTNQFSTPMASSETNASIPTLPANELHYHIVWYDDTVFENVTINASGIMTYTIASGADITIGSFMNIVFEVK
ncbi:hypothetical protein BWZ22_13550 [Seonamhaeicola sp. S2-3]|uniref:beta strand repeat-containing protein n=1 Tax=Seonamhaeicola sp. S2-3 TaxID=1936081 RepID=UPI000972D517|nr:hypothetical protein [Seonamhaeicola sp. S2-3]APY12186.1 hypothetical protein BWZ22_13550 [Seonamhaeicola sp. S2-3]